MSESSVNNKIQELLCDVDCLCSRWKLIYNVPLPNSGEPLVVPLENAREHATIVAGIMKKLLDEYGINFTMTYSVVSASSGALCWEYGYPIFTLIDITWNDEVKEFELVRDGTNNSSSE